MAISSLEKMGVADGDGYGRNVCEREREVDMGMVMVMGMAEMCAREREVDMADGDGSDGGGTEVFWIARGMSFCEFLFLDQNEFCHLNSHFC